MDLTVCCSNFELITHFIGKRELNDVWQYDIPHGEWIHLAWDPKHNPFVPPLRDAVAVIRGNHMYIQGGFTGREVSVSTFSFDTEAKQFKQVGYIPMRISA